jgi:GntR family transcriptional regulator/MocR family aminotransferase
VVRQAEDRELALSPWPRDQTRQGWLYDEIRSAILSGRLAVGSRLPATRDLARQYRLARGTVAAVYELLAAEGYVAGKVGRGTIVLAPTPDSLLQVPPRGRRGHNAPPSRRVHLSTRGRNLARSPFPMLPPAATACAFRAGQPDLAAFPLDLWTRLAGRRSRQNKPALLADADPRGYKPLRDAVAAHVAAARGISCSADHVIILSSVQQALDLSARLLLDPGDDVWLENPGYPGAAQILAAAGARVRAVAVDGSGLDVAMGLRSWPRARLAYVTPARQAPLGFPLSLSRRIALLRWAASAGSWIFEDDYDGEYRFAGRPRAALKSLDSADLVIYAGTFSKLLFPALRLAYVVLPDGLVDAFAAALSLTARHAAVMPQAVLADFIAEGHFSRHVRRMRLLYGERAAALQQAAQEYWSGLLDLPPIEAGLETAGRFPRRVDDVEISERVRAAGIETRPLSACAIDGALGARGMSGLILGFATVGPAAIRSAAQKLASVLDASGAKRG